MGLIILVNLTLRSFLFFYEKKYVKFWRNLKKNKGSTAPRTLKKKNGLDDTKSRTKLIAEMQFFLCFCGLYQFFKVFLLSIFIFSFGVHRSVTGSSRRNLENLTWTGLGVCCRVVGLWGSNEKWL